MSGGGVSACAVCDGALPASATKPLAVIGGGDTRWKKRATSRSSDRPSTSSTRDSFRASKIMQDRFMSRHNAKVLWNKIVIDVVGDSTITGVLVEDTKTRGAPPWRRGLFIAIGHTPATAFLKAPASRSTTPGTSRSPAATRTRHEGVFAGATVADSHCRQAVTAAGMGCQAAIDAERWLAAPPGLE